MHSEEKAIASVSQPNTVESLCQDLRRLGVRPGMTLLVHSSLSTLGWVCGGAVGVILALEQALGPEGTLVMPTHSGELSDPALWRHPPVPESWWETIRAAMPPFLPGLTPTRGMGIIPETFRKQDAVLRSDHPQMSFAARGPHAVTVTANHALDFGLGDSSPLARVYDLDGWVLLLGVDHDNNTSLHLAEYRAQYGRKRSSLNGAPILRAGERVWVQFQDIELDISDFPLIGREFEAETGQVLRGRIGLATALLMPQRALVDYAVHWMERCRW